MNEESLAHRNNDWKIVKKDYWNGIFHDMCNIMPVQVPYPGQELRKYMLFLIVLPFRELGVGHISSSDFSFEFSVP